MDNKIPYSHVLSDEEAENLVYSEMLSHGGEIIERFQKRISPAKKDTVNVRFMARTGEFKAEEHLAVVITTGYFDVDTDTEEVFAEAKIYRIRYRSGQEIRDIEHSEVFKATFTDVVSGFENIDARIYFGSKEWTHHYVVEPFQKDREEMWNNPNG